MFLRWRTNGISRVLAAAAIVASMAILSGCGGGGGGGGGNSLTTVTVQGTALANLGVAGTEALVGRDIFVQGTNLVSTAPTTSSGAFTINNVPVGSVVLIEYDNNDQTTTPHAAPSITLSGSNAIDQVGNVTYDYTAVQPPPLP